MNSDAPAYSCAKLDTVLFSTLDLRGRCPAYTKLDQSALINRGPFH